MAIQEMFLGVVTMSTCPALRFPLAASARVERGNRLKSRRVKL